MKRLADFLAHHNSVPIILGFLFLASGTALAASPVARDAVIGGVVTETVSVDNRAITDVSLDNFDAQMTIATVTEDAQNYYIAYRYHTFTVEDTAWKEVPKDAVLTVAKSALQSDDLKAYAIEQLRQVVESDLGYLKRVQAAEIANGRSASLVATSYHGLAGFAIEMKDILLPPAPGPVLAPANVAPPAPSAAEQFLSDASAVPVATTTTGASLVPVATTTTSTSASGEQRASTTDTIGTAPSEGAAPEATTTNPSS